MAGGCGVKDDVIKLRRECPIAEQFRKLVKRRNFGRTRTGELFAHRAAFDVGREPLRRVPMMEPLRGTAESVARLIDESDTPAELLARLGS